MANINPTHISPRIRQRYINAITRLEEQFSAHPQLQCQWLVRSPQPIFFCDLAFSTAKGKVYAVIFAEDNTVQERVALLKELCQSNHLTPCQMAFTAENAIAGEGWGITAVEDATPIIPQEDGEESQCYSQWERLHFGVTATARQILEQPYGEIISVTSMPNSVPQIWFKDAAGQVCWAMLSLNGTLPQLEEFLKANPPLQEYRGYGCRVDIAEDVKRGSAIDIRSTDLMLLHVPKADLPEETPAVTEEDAATQPTDDLTALSQRWELLTGAALPTDSKLRQAGLGLPPQIVPEAAEEKEVPASGCLVWIIVGVAALWLSTMI